MSFEFLHSSQNDSTNSAIQADPSAIPARLEADVLVVFFESDGLRGPIVEIDKAMLQGNVHERNIYIKLCILY